MELLIVLVLFTPVLLIGAGLEWLGARKPTWAGIKFYVSDWNELELGSDGDDAQLADPPVPQLVHRQERSDLTPVAFPQGPVAGGALVAVHAHDTAGHQNSHAYVGGRRHEAVSLEMFGGQFDGREWPNGQGAPSPAIHGARSSRRRHPGRGSSRHLVTAPGAQR